MDNAVFTGADGKSQKYYMGCYGIGLGRTLATIVEKFHDDKGMVWPKQIAPFDVHLISLKGAEEYAQKVYDQLKEKGIDVLWDEREGASAGQKFADADLIGVPVRLVVSPRNGKQVEFKERSSEQTEVISLDEVIKKIK